MKDTINYTCPNDVPVPIGSKVGGVTIANWLACDIQISLKTANEWLKVFSEVVNGSRQGGYQGTGNAFSVYANGIHVLLESEFAGSYQVYLNNEQITSVLTQYRSYLLSELQDLSFKPIPFDVEYIAEGELAKGVYLANGGII